MKNIHNIISLILVIDLWHKKMHITDRDMKKQKLVWTARLDFNILLLSQVKGFCRDSDVTTVEFNLVVVTQDQKFNSIKSPRRFPIQSQWYCLFLFVFFNIHMQFAKPYYTYTDFSK